MDSSLEEKSLNSFRISLLLTLLKTVVLFSVLTAFLSLLDVFPLELEYTYVVVAYALGMFTLTLLLIQNEGMEQLFMRTRKPLHSWVIKMS